MNRNADTWAELNDCRPWPEATPPEYPPHTHKAKHMKISEMIPSKYLKQSDVTEDTVVTVKGLKKVNVARDDEEPDYRWTILFHEYEKPMVLNTTNLKRLAKALGDDTDGWTGNSVILYVDPDIEFGGNVVGGLRIKSVPRTSAVRKPSTDDVNRKLAAAADEDVPF